MTGLPWRVMLLAGLCLALLGVGEAVLPGFLSPAQVANQLKIAAFVGLFGLCQTIVIAAGGEGLDLSVGAVATLGAVLGAAVAGGSDALMPPAFLAAGAAGLLVGLLNGAVVTVFGIPPLVATLAMSSLLNGALIVGVSSFNPPNAASPGLVLLAGRAGGTGIPNIVIIWAVLSGLAVWLFAHSGWGRRLLGTGASPLAALLSGTDVRAVRIAAFALSGTIAALSGFLLLGYVSQAFLGLGNAYVLTSVVVAAIGGVALAGGRAPYFGVACAAILITVLSSLLTAINIGEAGRQIIFGLTLLAILILDGQIERRRPA